MNLSVEAKVGAITVIGFLLFGLITFQLGSFSFGDKGDSITATFSHVKGLKAGNLVRYAGVEAGSVDAISTAPDGVSVKIKLKPGVRVPQNARVTIGTDGLLGEKFIDIVPPLQPETFLPAGSVIAGQDPRGLDEFMESADKVLQEVNKLVISMNEVMGDQEVKVAVKEAALNVRDITANMNMFSYRLAKMSENNEQDIRNIVVNLRDMSENLRDVSNRVDTFVAQVDNKGKTAQDIQMTVSNLKLTSERIEKSAASIENVVTDPEVKGNIKQTIQNARQATDKANKILSQFSDVKTKASVDVLYGSSKYKTNLGLTVGTAQNKFAFIGVNNMGEENLFNFQVGSQNPHWTERYGIIDSHLGAGLDYTWGKFTTGFSLYDPNEVRFNLRAEYQLSPELYLVGQEDNANKHDLRKSYLGLRHVF